MFKKTTCQILLHTDVSWKRYGLLKLMWYYTTFGLEQAKKVVHIAHLITPDSARQLILRTSKLMSAHLVKYAASARDLSLFHCDVLHSSSAVQHSTDPGIVYVYVSTLSSQWQICLHARIVHMLSMQWIHTHLCVHINAWISVRMLPHQFLFVTPTCAASHASPSIHNTDNTKDAYSWGNFGFSKSDRVFLWQTITGGQSLFSSHKTRTVLCFNTMHTYCVHHLCVSTDTPSVCACIHCTVLTIVYACIHCVHCVTCQHWLCASIQWSRTLLHMHVCIIRAVCTTCRSICFAQNKYAWDYLTHCAREWWIFMPRPCDSLSQKVGGKGICRAF